MSRQLVDAELRGFYPSNSGSTPDYTIAASDIENVDHEQRVGTLKDTGDFTVHNNDGSQADTISSGDRIEFHTQLDGEGSLSRRWTVMARKIKREREHNQSGSVQVQVGDYVSEILAMRTATGSFENVQIAGTSDSILDTLLAANCPEIDTSGVSTIAQTTTVTFDGTPMMRVLQELLTRAGYVAWSDDTTLYVDDLSSPSVEFDLNENDKSGWHTVEENDDNLVNRARVKGGVQFAEDEDAPSDTPTDYVTVTGTDRAIERTYTTKAMVARVEVYTRTVTGSDSSLRVRIQTPSSDGTQPRDASDEQADVARTAVPAEDIVDGGFTTVDFSQHELPNQDIFVIIEGSTTAGVEIGTADDASEFTYGWGTAAEPTNALDKFDSGQWIGRQFNDFVRYDVPDLQQPRYLPQVAADGEGTVYAFGGITDVEPYIETRESAEKWVPGSGEWVDTNMVTDGRYGGTAVYHPVEELIYLFGGLDVNGSGAGTIYAFDPETETWSDTGVTDPTSGSEKVFGNYVATANTIYFGEGNTFHSFTPPGTTDTFPSASFSSGTAAAWFFSATSAVAVYNGGVFDTYDLGGDGYTYPTPSTGPGISSGDAAFCVAPEINKAVVLGDLVNENGEFTVYDTTTETTTQDWGTSASDAGVTDSWGDVFNMAWDGDDELFYIVGGVRGQDGATRTRLYSYDPATESWVQLSQPPVGPGGNCAEIIGQHLWTVGYDDAADATRVLKYNTGTDTWTNVDTVTEFAYFNIAASYGVNWRTYATDSRIYIEGNEDWYWDTGSETWTEQSYTGDILGEYDGDLYTATDSALYTLNESTFVTTQVATGDFSQRGRTITSDGVIGTAYWDVDWYDNGSVFTYDLATLGGGADEYAELDEKFISDTSFVGLHGGRVYFAGGAYGANTSRMVSHPTSPVDRQPREEPHMRTERYDGDATVTVNDIFVTVGGLDKSNDPMKTVEAYKF